MRARSDGTKIGMSEGEQTRVCEAGFRLGSGARRGGSTVLILVLVTFALAWAGSSRSQAHRRAGSTGVPRMPSFAPPETLVAESNPHSIRAGDVNHDGKLDLVDANAGTSSVTVFRGNGDGTFSAGQAFSTGESTRPKSAFVADLDGDGRPDIVTANQDANTVSVLKGGGNGSFGRPVEYRACSRPHEVAVADLSGDRKPDLAVACWNGTAVSVLLGKGTGTFGPSVDYRAGSNPHSIVISDFNRDGTPDLAVADHGSAEVSVLLGSGKGTFRKAVEYRVGDGPHSVRAGDLNRDGRLDLITANTGSNNVTVLLGNGKGTFAAGRSYAAGLVPKGVAIGDLNGDRVPDIVTANTAGNGDGVTGHPRGDRVSVLVGTGNGSFRAPTDFLVGQTPFSVCIADLNRDGKADLATADWDSNTVTVRLNRTR